MHMSWRRSRKNERKDGVGVGMGLSLSLSLSLTDDVADEEAVLGRPLVVPAAVAGRRHDPPVVAADLERGGIGAGTQRAAEDGQEERERTEEVVGHRALALRISSEAAERKEERIINSGRERARWWSRGEGGGQGDRSGRFACSCVDQACGARGCGPARCWASVYGCCMHTMGLFYLQHFMNW
jgi:hypothetical protein